VVDVLEICEPERDCATCALFAECGGRAKGPRPGGGGHVAIDDALDMKARVSTSAWSCEMLALRPKRDDAVFPEFDLTRHVTRAGEPRLVGRAKDDAPEPLLPARLSPRTPPPPRLIAGMDFGYRGLTVVLWGTVDAAGVLAIVDERAVAHQRLDTHIEAVLDSPWGLPEWVGVDPAGRQSNQQTGRSNIDAMTRRGLKVRWRSIGVAPGVALVRARLDPAAARIEREAPAPRGPASAPAAPPVQITIEGSPADEPIPPRLLIDARCATLIDSLQRHHYDPDRPDRYDPVKDGTDHAADALRYLIVNLDQPHRTARHAAGTVWRAGDGRP
jgi:hypothetical protein